jgi:hypothetical protein
VSAASTRVEARESRNARTCDSESAERDVCMKVETSKVSDNNLERSKEGWAGLFPRFNDIT